MNKYSSILWLNFLFVAASFTSWLTYELYAQHLQPPAQETLHPDAFMYQVHAWQMDKFGHLRTELISPKLTHLPKNNQTLVDSPLFKVYEQNRPAWHINAKQALALKGMAIIELSGDIRMRQAKSTKNTSTEIKTEYLTLYPERKFAHTDAPVTIQQPGLIIDGVGLDADAKEDWAKLLSKVNAKYTQSQ